MGNRAVITATTDRRAAYSYDIGIYLHWNGGRDSVEAFLEYCKLQGFREPPDDYGMARLVQVISNFFGGGTSIGVDKCRNLDCDNYDNGVYQIKGWEIVGRQYIPDTFQEQDQHDLLDMLLEIDSKQPEGMRLGPDFIKARVVPVGELKVGDTVYIESLHALGPWEKVKVIGFGDDRWVNGHEVKGIPYTDRYPNPRPEINVNNYLFGKEYRLAN